ncbi:hypothetical protein MKX01_030185 [Papaver californicum]|nr:hypothetical protein MKX01_030185 [Papaver californicum]
MLLILGTPLSSPSPLGNKVTIKRVSSGVAVSLVLLSQTNQTLGQAIAAEPSHYTLCQLAAAPDKGVPLPLDEGSDGETGQLMMMRGMTAKNFDPVRYSGRWFELASGKGGFAGAGQEDCRCTQRVYTFDGESRPPSIQVDTFCVHGGPDEYITGIRGKVQCLSEKDMEEKCTLRFPTLPFIPKLPYDIYSRTPNPGPEFIEKYKSYLANYGYDPSKINDTPQDCDVSDTQLSAMMSMPGMQKSSVEFDPFTSTFGILKKLVQLYFK